MKGERVRPSRISRKSSRSSRVEVEFRILDESFMITFTPFFFFYFLLKTELGMYLVIPLTLR